MVFDPQIKGLLLFGGSSNQVDYNDTWMYDHRGWSLLHPLMSPPGRSQASMAYDPLTHSVILYGGFNMTINLNDTWRFSNGSWLRLNDGSHSSPPMTWAGALAFDGSTGRAVLFGGGPGVSPRDETWIYNAGNWTRDPTNSSSTPHYRNGAGMFYDQILGRLVLTSGGYYDAQFDHIFSDTWLFANDTWSNISTPRNPHASWLDPVVYDDAVKVGILLAQDGTTWLFKQKQWFNANVTRFPWGWSPHGAAAAADATGTVIVFGGDSFPPGTNSTIVLLGGPGGFLDSAASSSTPVLDVNQSLTITTAAGGGDGTYSYAYSGLPEGCLSTDSAVLRCSPSTAGDYHINATVSDAGGNSSSSFLNLRVNALPGLTLAGGPVFLDSGQTISFSLNFSGGTLPFQTRWTSLPDGCPATSSSVLSCAPGVGFWAVQGASCDAVKSCVTSNIIPVNVNPSLLLLMRTWGITGTAVYGVLFHVETSGGTAPFSFDWIFGDGGRSTTSSSSIVHNYSGPGTWTAVVHVNDSVGEAATASLSLVLPDLPPEALSIALGLSRNEIDLGQSVEFTVSSVGTVSPLSYNWSGLPSGCQASPNAATFACVPDKPGFYDVRVAAAGANATSALGAQPLVVYPELNVSVTSRVISTCQATMTCVLFLAASSGGGGSYTYRWDWGDNSSGLSGALALHSYSQSAALYRASVTVSDRLGGSASNSTSITSGFSSSPSNRFEVSPTAAVLILAAATGGILVTALAMRGRRSRRRR